MVSTEKIPNDISSLQGMVKTLLLRNQQLEEMMRQMRGEKFGASSEKISEEQLRLFNLEESDSILPENELKEEVESYTRKKGGRKSLSKNLKIIRVEHDLSPEQKQCPCGCGEMEKIGEEISEQVHYVPAKYEVIENVRFKYACKKCAEGVYISSLPLQLLPKSNATPGFLAHIVVSKFQDGLPLYRQSKIIERSGFEISRATLSNWVVKSGEKMQPLVNLLLDHVLENGYIGMDETPVQVLNEENRKAQTQSYMWVIRGGPPGKEATLFYYDPTEVRKC